MIVLALEFANGDLNDTKTDDAAIKEKIEIVALAEQSSNPILSYHPTAINPTTDITPIDIATFKASIFTSDLHLASSFFISKSSLVSIQVALSHILLTYCIIYIHKIPSFALYELSVCMTEFLNILYNNTSIELKLYFSEFRFINLIIVK